MSIVKKPLLLVVLDGWGIRQEREANAIQLAGAAHYERMLAQYPSTELDSCGLAVGLPEGQMGNSEVGHTNLGAGRVVYQDLVRINRACESGELESNPALQHAIDSAKKSGGALHLLGLVSPGGVHSSMVHLEALTEMARQRGLSRVFVHAFLDGRDTPPKSGLGYVEELTASLARRKAGEIATVGGRYWGMDRDKRWDRVQRAYAAMLKGEGFKVGSGIEAVKAGYERGETDEFVSPTVVVKGDGSPVATIRDGDAVLFFNFRADRAREMTRALTAPEFSDFERGPAPRLSAYVCMTEYDRTFGLPVAFPPEQPTKILPEVLADKGLKQFRTAETEKYAHVTFFFNGGREITFPGEDRHLVPSPRDVKTYDLKPQMSAREVTAELCKRIDSRAYDFMLVNFANPDMVGHTGVLPAAIQAVKVVDECLGEVQRHALAAGTAVLITADHGNCEMMVDPVTGEPHTAHTLNPVPLLLVDPELKGAKLRRGILADVAPTVLTAMGFAPPVEMSGKSLLIR
jgi:2,3-bisphosphoglycerate-independent phosphoglycerate mutase